jgi:hypothetical protein
MNKQISNVMCKWPLDKQLYFLKVYPILKLKPRIIDLWIDTYKTIHENNNQKNHIELNEKNTTLKKTISNLKLDIVTKSEYNKLMKLKTNMINFLEKGIINNYIYIQESDIAQIIDLFSQFEQNKTYINRFKFYAAHTSQKINGLEKSNSYIFKKDNISDFGELIRTHTEQQLPYKLSIINIDPIEFANELTRITSTSIHKINIHELIHLAMKDNYDVTSIPNLTNCLNDFNKITYWVVSEIILNFKNTNDKLAVVKKFVNIASELKNLNNYHMFFAILLGLNHYSVQRIKFLWEPNSEHTIKYNQFLDIIMPIDNYKNYRNILDNLKSKHCIPYIGLVLKDIKHLSEISFYTETEFNWKLYNVVVDIIKSYEQITKKYDIIENKNINTFITNMKCCCDDNVLYNKSINISKVYAFANFKKEKTKLSDNEY